MAPKRSDRTLAIPRSLLDSGRLRKNVATLVVLQGPEIGRNFRLTRDTIVLGRDPGATFRLADGMASREHARIDCRYDAARRVTTYAITDLESTNHTWVNNRQVQSSELRDGDKIQVGDTVLKFVLLDDVEATFHEQIRERIERDRLTGLLTKESLYLALGMELDRCLHDGQPLSVLMMDLDHFKAVNDTHGHLMGSHVLSEVGRLIRESTRAEDVSARYGGEEFVSYLVDTPPAGARGVAERIRRAIDDHAFTLDGRTIHVTISIGIALCPAHGRDVTALVGAADRALYRAKETGRNRICLEPVEEGGR